MTFNYPQRRSIRLPRFDYSCHGVYFVTIDTFDRNCIFGDVRNEVMIKNKFGSIADNCWRNIPSHFPNTDLLDYIVMPNHIHGVIVIRNKAGAACCAPTGNRRHGPAKGSLGAIVRSFKSAVTKTINVDNLIIWPVWQRGYYDRIIRNAKELKYVIEYIRTNPTNWNKEAGD